MTSASDQVLPIVGVRYWAAARAAAQVEYDEFEVADPIRLSDLLETAVERRPGLARVVDVCSVLIDEEPVGTSAPAEVLVHPGQVADLLPPFAGG